MAAEFLTKRKGENGNVKYHRQGCSNYRGQQRCWRKHGSPSRREWRESRARARRKDRIDALVSDITAKGGCALGFKTDVTKRGDVEALVRGTVDKYGRIDAIVNNSGIMPIAPMAALKVEEWDRMIDVNIKGLLYGVAAVLPI